jgi:hypothetical protein
MEAISVRRRFVPLKQSPIGYTDVEVLFHFVGALHHGDRLVSLEIHFPPHEAHQRLLRILWTIMTDEPPG